MVQLQGGDLNQLPQLTWVPVKSPVTGVVANIDCARLGNLLTTMGGGRRQKDDKLNHRTGIKIDIAVGDLVQLDQPVGHVCHDNPASFTNEVLSSITWNDTTVPPLTLVLETIG